MTSRGGFGIHFAPKNSEYSLIQIYFRKVIAEKLGGSKNVLCFAAVYLCLFDVTVSRDVPH